MVLNYEPFGNGIFRHPVRKSIILLLQGIEIIGCVVPKLQLPDLIVSPSGHCLF